MDRTSIINNIHPNYLNQLYESYLNNPSNVDESWQTFFEGFDLGLNRDDTRPDISKTVQKEISVLNMITDYRRRGHLFTHTNPVRKKRHFSPTLDIENYGLSQEDLTTRFACGAEIGIGTATLKEIIDHLEKTYCSNVGVEYLYIRDVEKVKWLQEKMEPIQNTPIFDTDMKTHLLSLLNKVSVFENFLHTRYVGQTRFSIQGGETLIPGIEAVIETGAQLGVEEFLLGMPHRGRLSVLGTIFNKDHEEIFSEFEGYEYEGVSHEGDVKYHLGYTTKIHTRRGIEVQLGMAPNPSHLEAVDPVVQGMARAKIEHKYGGNENKVVPILVHGDAALAGQGVVYEVAQMSQLKGYRTGGTIHLVVNNQIGFTTNFFEARSSTYCTDVAKTTLSPVFHVNADDVEMVVYVIQLAMEYRQRFHHDVYIDLLGYRRYGHNEGDEPRFTQPKLYKAIMDHPTPREIYYQKLLAQGSVEKGIAQKFEKEFSQMLQQEFSQAKEGNYRRVSPTFLDDCDVGIQYNSYNFDPLPHTAVDANVLLELGEKIFKLPEPVHKLPKLEKLYNERYKKLLSKENYDWGMGEMLAYASLLNDHVTIRISGQDTIRGTFAHRHAIVYYQDTEVQYTPLNHLGKNKGKLRILNSLLSEYGVLGFEYGYACANPCGLTIWEAQYGDFVNGAQIIIDQFISSSLVKWNRSNGIVLYLPHGYEGQGPEHSSARIERFLSLCAQNNMQIANCTTPANFFHLLRAHMSYSFRVPLILFTPKSLLRNPQCVSRLEDFSRGTFQRVMDDPDARIAKVTRLLFCSGKVYYDLLKKKQEDTITDTALIRLEQLYPFPEKEIQAIIKRYTRANQFYWVQEESENSGAWYYMAQKVKTVDLEVISRDESASPANGYFKRHIVEQTDLLERAFGAGS